MGLPRHRGNRTTTARRAGAGLLVVALLAAAMAHARADDAGDGRSIASAQAFLRQVLPGNRYMSTAMSLILARAGNEGLRAQLQRLPVIFNADPVAECRSFLLADITATTFVVRDPASDVVETALSDLLQDQAVGSPDGFDFGSIRALGQAGSRVTLRFAGERYDAVVDMEGEEIARRVHGAFDDLRMHCDTAVATGF